MAKKCITLIFFVLISSGWMSTVGADQRLTLILDWFPNVDHLPLYVARHQGFFSEEGLEIKIMSPSDTADGLKLAASNQVDIAISYEPQTIIGAARGLDVAVFGRLVEHPLTTLLFLKGKGIEKPKDLEGKRIGYTVPGLMDVLLNAFAKVNGIKHYSAVNVGFAIVQSLTAGKVDAVMGPFKTYETVTMAHRGYDVGYFELEKWGIPDYDELVFISSKSTLKKYKKELAAFRRVIDRAIALVRQNPDQALKYYFKELPESDRRTETDAFKLTLPYFASNQILEVQRWQQFADFAVMHGLIKKNIDVASILWAAE